MNKKKIILLILTLAVAISLSCMLASCDRDNDTADTPTHQPTEAPTEAQKDAPTEPPTEPPTEQPTDAPCEHEYDNNCDAVCNKCEAKRTASPHVEVTLEGKAPTCTEAGLTSGTACSVCTEIITAQNEIAPTGHSEVTDAAISPTCTEGGLTEGSHCSVCDEVLVAQTTVAATGHTEQIIPAVDATCEAGGKTQGAECLVCGEVTVAQTDTEPTGHNYSTEYEGNDKYHWYPCTNEGCDSVSGKEEHSSKYVYCDICDRKLPSIPCYYMDAATGSNRCKAHSFDFVYFNGEVIGKGTDGTSNSITELSIVAGDSIGLRGWVGFSYKEIQGFGYYLGNDMTNTFVNESFMSDAEDGVLAAGGKYAKRFEITADTTGAENGVTSISFVAILDDGTYIIIESYKLTVTGSWDGVVIPDGEVTPAGKDRLPDTEHNVELVDGEYVSSTGLHYTAAGEGVTFSAESGRFTITKENGLKINISSQNEWVTEPFNKYNVGFYSSAPLKVIMTYTDNSELVTDVVYFEAGENLFSCLTLGYLKHVCATNIASIEIQILGNSSSAEFALYDITTEQVDVIEQGLTYIANERYVLGVKVAWGGGISFLLDKNDGKASLTNLINNADTGRLIQQSYYGTGDEREYERGTYGSTKWNYNPVQGGNQFNDSSRIIDVEINERSIYIKAQPRDWAKTELAPSYMENVYTVYSDRIQVDNRFIDFSGYRYHPQAHQELPAFYTVGYLNTFAFYNGVQPWTGGALQYEESLAFWAGNSNAYFNINARNTETWCAWINKAADYGIGLYTPNISILLAGRHAYESEPDTVNPASGSCSYVAPLRTLRLASFEALEYSYLITCGSTEEIRDTFTAYKDFADNADLSDSTFS
ncbi:MAG: hypothetical protein IJW65_06565 [Clostridia bacterium]|nr:hypothetical protein [Clostridia bacterium]